LRYIEPLACAHPQRVHDGAETPSTISLSQASTIAEIHTVVIENVRAIATEYNGRYRDFVLKRLAEIGYQTEFDVLNAADYGVPQLRRRAFFVAFADPRVTYEFPTPTHGLERLPYTTVGEAIMDLARRGDSVPNCVESHGKSGSALPFDSRRRNADTASPIARGNTPRQFREHIQAATPQAAVPDNRPRQQRFSNSPDATPQSHAARSCAHSNEEVKGTTTVE
jgi:site-specific DNA-cytosine methylase